ncbi:hypothetical protein CEQ90_00740 [Lewinellaceae bacterium SD302]|nr:hypothetical protein CEQ90_00740 [Lewinellaceae bacterium SD302]
MNLLEKIVFKLTGQRQEKQPPNLLTDTQNVIKSVQAEIDGDLITYWGAANSSIAGNDGIVFGELLRNRKPAEKLYLMIKSNGGSGESSLRILNLLRQHYSYIVALVPSNCASAATMLALGANEIWMGPLSYLTAVDTSITHDLSPVDKDDDLVSVSQNELDRVLKLWNGESKKKDANAYKSLYEHIHPLVFGAVDRASSLSIKLTSEILSYHMKNTAEIDKISHQLNSEYPSHGYPITPREALKLGLPVKDLPEVLNSRLMELNHLYSQMAQRCYTDYSEYKYHNNQIYTVIERLGLQTYYQTDKDFTWRKEDKSWVSGNDDSGWKKNDQEGNIRNFYIR